MKNLLTMFVLVTTMLSFAACSNDDDDSTKDVPQKDDVALIVGTWKQTKVLKYASPNDVTGKEDASSATETSIITFNSDGTYTSVYSVTDSETVERENGTYSLKGGKICLNNGESYEYDYRFSGTNTFIVTVYSDIYDKYPQNGYKLDRFYSRQ